MATVQTTAVIAGVRPDANCPAGVVLSRSGLFTLAASDGDATALASGDVIEMVPVPKGAQIIDIMLEWTDLDSSSGPTMDVGDGDATNGYLDGLDITAAGKATLTAGTFVAYSIGKEYTAADTIDCIICDHSPDASSGTIKMVVLYKVEGAIDDET
jgi:hypothetical protein